MVKIKSGSFYIQDGQDFIVNYIGIKDTTHFSLKCGDKYLSPLLTLATISYFFTLSKERDLIYMDEIIIKNVYFIHKKSGDLLYHVDDRGRTNLMNAIIKDKIKIVKKLYDHNLVEDANYQDDDGNTALMLACGTSCFSFILANSKNINMVNNQGVNLFMLACIMNEINVIEILYKYMKNSLQLNVQDDRGNTAFMNACLYSDISIIKFLIDNKLTGDTNIRNKAGETAFILACMVRVNVDITLLLIDNGIETSITNYDIKNFKSRLLKSTVQNTGKEKEKINTLLDYLEL
jgi:ankyrin repeat protein